MFKIEITASTAIELGEKIAELAAQYGVGQPTTADETPKARKPRKASTDGDAANTAASEPSTPNASTLEPEATIETVTLTPEEMAQIPDTPEKPAPESPSRDDVLTAATKFSQKHGADALMGAINSIEGAKKFSDIAAADYPAFLAAMDKHEASASALS